jgi:ADP-ribose pyrophosphatase YjhB (NUDIX family)
VLEVVVVTRADTGQLALPSGFIDSNEAMTDAMRRVFAEEALGLLTVRTCKGLCQSIPTVSRR